MELNQGWRHRQKPESFSLETEEEIRSTSPFQYLSLAKKKSLTALASHRQVGDLLWSVRSHSGTGRRPRAPVPGCDTEGGTHTMGARSPEGDQPYSLPQRARVERGHTQTLKAPVQAQP